METGNRNITRRNPPRILSEAHVKKAKVMKCTYGYQAAEMQKAVILGLHEGEQSI